MLHEEVLSRLKLKANQHLFLSFCRVIFSPSSYSTQSRVSFSVCLEVTVRDEFRRQVVLSAICGSERKTQS